MSASLLFALFAQLYSVSFFPMLRINAPTEVQERYRYIISHPGVIECWSEDDDPTLLDCLWDDPVTMHESHDVLFVINIRPVPIMPGGVLYDVGKIYWVSTTDLTIKLWDPVGEGNSLVHDSVVCIPMCEFLHIKDPPVFENFCTDKNIRRLEELSNPRTPV